MNKLYIGISGKMGSGKSTLTQGIREALSNFSSETISMATPIKRLESLIYQDLELEHTKKDRDLLIALGMWGRNIDSDFWLKRAVERVSDDVQLVICDDIRFENEAKWFKENGLLLRIEGEQRGENVDPSKSEDITETALDNFPFDYFIDNRADKETVLMSALYCIAQHLKVSEELMNSIAEGLRKEG